MKITSLAAGTWGITLATMLHQKGHQVQVWEYDPRVVDTLLETRKHPKLPGFDIPADLPITTDIALALDGSETIVSVVPAAFMRETCRYVSENGYNGQLFIICSKGIEQGTTRLLADVARDELGDVSKGRIGVLSGPSHAEEVSRNIPTAVTAAGETLEVAEQICELFMTPYFRIYTQTDLMGVELAASLKNVIAIACGIANGMGFGDNSKAALLTRGLYEMVRLGVRLGAKPETFYGLAGVGDLVVTCMSPHSRNWKFGSLLGKGRGVQEALEEVGMVVEGYHTVRAAVDLARSVGVDMPITEEVGEILFGGKSVKEAVPALMERQPKSEMEG